MAALILPFTEHDYGSHPVSSLKMELIPICNQDDLYVLYYQLFGNALLICGDLRNQRLIFFVFESYRMQEERRFSAADLTDLR